MSQPNPDHSWALWVIVGQLLIIAYMLGRILHALEGA